MKEYRLCSQRGSPERKVRREEDGKIQYLLRAEEQPLRLISSRERRGRPGKQFCCASGPASARTGDRMANSYLLIFKPAHSFSNRK
jgi:hypothetical protein